MFPGSSTKLSESVLASAASIAPKTDLVNLTGSTQVNTIVPPLSGGRNAGILIVIPKDGNLVFGTSGNILVGATVAQNRPCTFVYSEIYDRWSIGPIS
jgi:hypothetical protein